ncbi:MAG TPA: response regulator transcription factor [Patescibacteria group bacterium]
MRILVVEDESNLAHSIKIGLEEEKFAVDIMQNGEKAYEQASVEEYDVIILDRMLPEMDGVEVCKKLREAKIFTPVLMLSARNTTEDKIEGLDSGADDYLTKPFLFVELLARIRALIRRATTKEVILTLDSLSINPTTHVVTRKGEEISLTAKEYALLEFFMRHPNQIVTREQITSHVWDYSFDAMSNTIEVLIKRLRSKIDKAFPKEKQLFVTVRGLGYKIAE